MAAPRVVGPHGGQLVSLGGAGARFLIDGDDAGNRFALVEHHLCYRTPLAAPMHRHHREGANSFIFLESVQLELRRQ